MQVRYYPRPTQNGKLAAGENTRDNERQSTIRLLTNVISAVASDVVPIVVVEHSSSDLMAARIDPRRIHRG
jgi:hypothetical protein